MKKNTPARSYSYHCKLNIFPFWTVGWENLPGILQYFQQRINQLMEKKNLLNINNESNRY